MANKKLTADDIEFGDIIVLYDWSYLEEEFEHERHAGKYNGNLVTDLGYRLFVSEKELYGLPYFVTSAYENTHGSIVNCKGKRDVSLEEIKQLVKKNSSKYDSYLKKVTER